MTLNQLLYFCAVTRTGSYSRAAEEADVSVAVVYRAIRTLEKECGVKLLERIGKAICPTPAGRGIYDYVLQITSLADQTSQALARYKGVMSSRISIGGDTTISSSLLPEVLVSWMAEHPNVALSVSQGRRDEIETSLLEERLDLGLSSRGEHTPGLRRELVFSDNLVVVCVPDYQLPKTGVVRLPALSKEKMIMPYRGTPIRDEIEQVEYQYAVQFKVALEVNRQYIMKRFCEKGAGIAVLPMSVVADDVASSRLRIVNVEGFPRTRAYFLVHRTDKLLTPEITSLISAIHAWAESRNGDR